MPIKIAFIFDKKQRIMSLGSYRIHAYDLCNYFKKINIVSSINPGNLEEYNVIILPKGCSMPENYQNLYKNKIIGQITPDCSNIKHLKNLDFILVGSIEEKESFRYTNKDIVMFPQIESMYLNQERKNHEKKDQIIIGYHGNQNHLNHMKYGLKRALERLSTEHNIKLIYTCSNNKEWVDGIPNIDKEFIKWDINKIHNTIRKFDIGIVPNISEHSCNKPMSNNTTLGLYNTDMSIRFKNKSNIGRALVLFQMGIPVVADITPSNLHMLGNPDNGYAVLNEHGWYNALKDLCCEKKRNFISKNAYEEVKRLYDPLEWAQRMHDNLNEIYDKRYSK